MATESIRSAPPSLADALCTRAPAALRSLVATLQEDLTARDALVVRARTHPRVVERAVIGALLRLVFEQLADSRGLRFDRAEVGRRLAGDDLGVAAPAVARAVAVARATLIPADAPADSFAALEIEAFGAVHETLVGYRVALVDAESITMLPHGVVVGVDALLACKARGAWLAEHADCRLGRARAAVERAENRAALLIALEAVGAIARDSVIAPGTLAVHPTTERRRAGAHYTPRALAATVVDWTISPLLDGRASKDTIRETLFALRVCDPAMGSGVFLLAAHRLMLGWLRASSPTNAATDATDATDEDASAVAERCIAGVDINPLSVEVARLSLWLESGGARPLAFLDHALRVGDSLVGKPELRASRPPNRFGPIQSSLPSFDWHAAYPDLAAGADGGFDAIVGNPPWVSFAGRAAQPITDALRKYLREHYESFADYPSLHGAFVERAATLLKPGGRLGLIVPSSMGELSSYAPARRALARSCDCDEALPDLGNGLFPGVFQPCMALLSTRRRDTMLTRDVLADVPWPIARDDLTDLDRQILAKLEGPPLAPDCFGERGLQSMGGDATHWQTSPDDTHDTPLRTGSDIRAFERLAPSLFADPCWFGRRLRSAEQFIDVDVLIRQTARYPIATRSDGAAFRNSILAGFATADYSADFLVAYLNSTPIRYRHFLCNRDARQGMPQMKIGALRSLPAPRSRAVVPTLEAIGAALGDQNRGLDPARRVEIDALVAEAFGLTNAELEWLVAKMANVR